MSKLAHSIYIGTMVVIVVVVTLYIGYTGYSYYSTVLEERFYHPHHDWFKPSGIFGHGIGILGSLMMLIGVVIYIARKRYNFMGRYLRLKYLLEFHIFLCTLGPILILYHTAFKFGGIVSIAFWSMVAVVLSGVVGRFIYIQIPRTIEGRELSLNEIKNLRNSVEEKLQKNAALNPATQKMIDGLTDHNSISESQSYVSKYFEDRRTIQKIKRSMRMDKILRKERRAIIAMVRDELALTNRILRLQKMQQLFKYWHVAHLPFALIMLIILVVHVGVTLAFGYKWIFS